MLTRRLCGDTGARVPLCTGSPAYLLRGPVGAEGTAMERTMVPVRCPVCPSHSVIPGSIPLLQLPFPHL